MTRGAITLLRYRGVPIRAHWSVPIMALLVGGARFAPGAWLGLLLVVVLHEMGHAFWALRYQLDVREILIHGLVGHCAYAGTPTPRQRAVVAWGGVMAQAIVLAIAMPLSIVVPARNELVADLYAMLIRTNLFIALFNLVPLAPLDGAEAWKLVPLLFRPEPRVERKEIARARAAVAPRTLGEAMGPVDAGAVRDTVRRALDDARRDSRGQGDGRKR